MRVWLKILLVHGLFRKDLHLHSAHIQTKLMSLSISNDHGVKNSSLCKIIR